MVKFIRFSFAILTAMSLFSCARVQDPYIAPQQIGDKLILKAYWAQDDASRTLLQEDGTSIYWSVGESINVFYGSNQSKFTSTNSDTTAVVDFEGALDIVTGAESSEAPYFWAVYPYNEANTCDGEAVTLALPVEQTGYAGSFADKFFPAIARSSSADLAFYNVCGGVRFSVVKERVNRVVLRSLDGSPLTGKVQVGFGEDGKPEIRDIIDGVDSVAINAPDTSFIVGKDYFVALLPQEHASGISISLRTSLQSCVIEKQQAITVKRSVFGILDNVDEGIKYDGPEVIKFKDREIEKVCVANFDTDGDGLINEYEEAAITSLGQAFRDNQKITIFSELADFTGLTALDDACFSGCTALKTIELPAGILTIGDFAFESCSKIKNLAFPEGLVSIGESAFEGCSGLRSVNIEACSQLKTIGASAFNGCTGTANKDITIPASVKYIGSLALAPFLYVNLQAEIPPTIFSDSFNAAARIGVPAAALKRYKTKKLTGAIWAARANWVYPDDIFCYPPSMKTISSGRKQLNLFGHTMDFIWVEAGSYTQGSNTVTISQPFWLAATQCTRAVWIDVMNADPSNFLPTNPEAIYCPVTRVSWENVFEFITELKKLVPGNYRLPTEAQWMFAAKGGNESRGYVYSGSDNIDDVAWYTDNSRCCLDTTGAVRKQPHPVATKNANELGFYDMSGNVFEWVNDYYGGTYAVPQGTDPTGPAIDSQKRRVLLGGDYLSDSKYCLLSYRSYAKQATAGSNYCFRLAL